MSSMRSFCLRSAGSGGYRQTALSATRRNFCRVASQASHSMRRELPARAESRRLQTITNFIPKTIVSGRVYSTESPLGTIAKGAEGTSESFAPPPDHLNENETAIYEMLMRELQCTRLDVKDISGGCGSMYGIEVESERFRGLNMLKQQRMVNEVLKEKMESEGWHGVQLRTAVPPKTS